MRHGSLFSGIGGFDLASEWMGWENVFHCEWNEFGQKILKYYWPNAISYGDITKTDFTIHRGQIDILTGGFPCQPYSMAGKRKGKEDDRHLWPEMLRSIREIQPGWVVGENVPGIINWSGGLVFHEVQTDLEAEGYEVFPVVLPACGVNAPHKRERVWFIAHSINSGHRNNRGQGRKEDGLQGVCREALCSRMSDGAITGTSSNTLCKRYSEFPGRKDNTKEWTICQEEQTVRNGIWAQTCGCSGVTSDTSHKGLQGSKNNGSSEKCGEKRNKQFTGCFRTNWKEFPTEPPLCSRNDGISSELDGITFSKWRNESIKAYGNAIVPQVAYQIFKAIEKFTPKSFAE